MHRFYITPENWNPDSLVLSDSEAHHARDVHKDVREVCPKPFAQHVQLGIVPQVAENRAVAFLAQGLGYPGHAYTRFAQQS